jgi:hypothetical protein|tara:strand:+ start:2887 stop:3144 length:258 start_codon:yes stop_codon:yes gene_type:complete
MSRTKLSKKQKVFNLLSKGENVTWKLLRKRFDLTSPTKMIDTLKSDGHCIYTNDTSKGVAYRMGNPSKEIIAAGIASVLGTKYAY